VNSCKDQFDFSTDNLSTNIEQKSSFALPLVDASITLSEVIPNNEDVNRALIVDPDGFLRLEFEYEVTQVPASDYFDGSYSGATLPDISYKLASQVFELGLNKLISEGEFYLADPKVTITIKNYWDIPAQFKFADFYYYEEPESAGIPVTGSFIDWIQINKPVAPEAYAITNIVLDKTTSNIDEIISALPHHLSFGADFETITTPPVSYDVPSSSIDSVSMKVEMPLDLRIANLLLRDTIDFNLGNDLGSDTSMIESFEFSLILQNGFPIEIGTQVYFVDENYSILDSISTNLLQVASGIVTAGKVSQSTESIIKIQIDKNRLSNLLNSSYLMPKIIFNTAGNASNETVKFYDNYDVGLKLGALINLKLKN
ncbi:MAG: hypothetical protein P1P88_21935, partial [Bacteroidales bacterium]|nr:hypothetical protein [Bacteroidales bacterium]